MLHGHMSIKQPIRYGVKFINLPFVICHNSKFGQVLIYYIVKVFISVLAILGSIIGAGFVSGQEIVVFYSKFGLWSILLIILSFFIFYKFFNFLINLEEKSRKNSKKQKIYAVSSVFNSIIFSSAMFAGTIKMISFSNKAISFFLFCLVIFLCFIIFKNGISSIGKVSFLLVPILIIVLLVFEISILKVGALEFSFSKFNLSSIIYSFFYCGLNISNASMLIVSLGKKLSQKQKTRVSFYSALVLFFLLLITDIVLLSRPDAFSSDMPLLSLFSGNKRILMNLLVLIGSLTSLFSLIFASSNLMRGLSNNDFIVFLVSVICPAFLSFFGFTAIITYLYPIASMVSILLLSEMVISQKEHSSC